MTQDPIRAAAHRLHDATEQRVPCAPILDLLADGDVAAAYAVQRINTDRGEAGGRRVVGWKIGLTSPAVQAQLGVDQPDFGLLFADCDVAAGTSTSARRLLEPRIEAEVAFVLGSDLPERVVGADDVRRATAHVAPALEIVDSRVAGWDITIVDTIADNASSGLYVIGDQRVPLGDLDLRPLAMSLTADGEVASTGTGAACLGDPIDAVVWLANTARGVGRPLRAGDLVLSGALGPMIPVRPGSTYRGEIEELGAVSVTFDEEG
jgi:2-keto-4-pentenoate hydratase